MANSKYEYVRLFELQDTLLPNTWIVVRVDGRGFHKFSAKYEFQKPNDKRALDLMNDAASKTMKEIPDVVFGYGSSDEFSFVLHKDCSLFDRRASKLVTTIVSTFTAYYVYLWSEYFPDIKLTQPLPSFDGRAVCYPSIQNLRDYLCWRQVDCHINNLYNTTFWSLVQKGGMSRTEAEQRLSGTVSSDKNEILFSQFGINYNNEAEMFKKGSALFRDYELETPQPKSESQQGAQTAFAGESSKTLQLSKTATEKERKIRARAGVAVEHVDIMKDDFWERRAWILAGRTGKPKTDPISRIL